MSGVSRIKRRLAWLGCVALLAMGAVLTVVWRENNQQRTLIRDTEALDGGYLTVARGPSWLPANRITRQMGTDDDLEYLFLVNTDVDGAWLARLEGHDGIRQILLQETDVTDAGLEHLSTVTNLERLRLDDTLVTDDGLEYLRNLKRLQQLNLTGTDVTDAGVARLQSALPNCQVIRR